MFVRAIIFLHSAPPAAELGVFTGACGLAGSSPGLTRR